MPDTPAKDPLGLLTDDEYQAWLDERPPLSEEEKAEIDRVRAEQDMAKEGNHG